MKILIKWLNVNFCCNLNVFHFPIFMWIIYFLNTVNYNDLWSKRFLLESFLQGHIFQLKWTKKKWGNCPKEWNFNGTFSQIFCLQRRVDRQLICKYVDTDLHIASRCCTRGGSRNYTGEKAIEVSILTSKPRGDVTRSPKQWYQWPHKNDLCPPKISQEKKLPFKRSDRWGEDLL